MVVGNNSGQRTIFPAKDFPGMHLNAAELARARATMAQAEAIAAGIVAVFKGLAAAGKWLRDGASAGVRRVRSAFMHLAHH